MGLRNRDEKMLCVSLSPRTHKLLRMMAVSAGKENAVIIEEALEALNEEWRSRVKDACPDDPGEDQEESFDHLFDGLTEDNRGA